VSYGEKAEFFLIYISEAHPEMTKNDGQVYGKTESTDERAILAQKCMTEMKLSIPVLIDSMEGQAEKAYRGRPDRIAVIDVDGNVAYYGERGPWGFKPLDAEKALQALLKEQE